MRISELDELQREVGQWADRTFPHSSPDSITSHLTEEVEELSNAAHLDYDGRGAFEDEAADCLLLLLHLAHTLDFSLWQVMLAKHATNVARTWETDAGGRGHRKHTEGPSNG